MIRLVFTRSTGIVAWLIRLVAGGRASHCGIHYREQPDAPDLVIHADYPGGVQVVTRSAFLSGGRRLLACYEALPETEAQLDLAHALSLEGEPYDVGGLAGDVVPTLARRVLGLRGVRNPLADRRRWICSEFLVTGLDPSGRVFGRGIDPETVTPRDLLRLVSRHRGFRRVEEK